MKAKDAFAGLHTYQSTSAILLKRGINDIGESVIYHKKGDIDWCIRLTFTNETLCNKIFDYLTEELQTFFKSDE